MREQPAGASAKLRARVAGVLYLLTIAAGVFAEVFVRGALVVRDDAAATAANILTHEVWYRSGLAADLIMLACYLGVTLLLYVLLKPAGAHLSRLAALFSSVGVSVLAANSLHHVAPLLLLGPAPTLGAFDTQQLQALAHLSLRMHARGYHVSGVFFGAYCALLGHLIFRSGFLPRALGVLLAAGGVSYLTHSFALFLSPPFAARLPDVMLLGGVAELSLALWLLAAGVNAPAWEVRATAAARAGDT